MNSHELARRMIELLELPVMEVSASVEVSGCCEVGVEVGAEIGVEVFESFGVKVFGTNLRGIGIVEGEVLILFGELSSQF